MRKDDHMYTFAFRGLLAEQALDKAGRRHEILFSEEFESKASERLGLQLIDKDFVIRARRMSIVYTAICAFENSVREFISKKLLEEIGGDWWEKCVKSEVRKRAEDRKEKEQGMRWLTQRGSSLIDYTEFGDLISIMANSNNWDFFEPHIIDIEWAKQIITTLEKSRHVIMHSGELDQKDIERVGASIRDWVAQVGG